MNAPAPRRARRVLSFAVALVLLLAGAELASRTVLGLGTPPLFEADPLIEYRLKPSQDVQRFGNRVSINRWSMRSPDFDAHKTQANELRVMVFGDSVVYGGNQIDQQQLSTTLLQASLQSALDRPVTVGNVSAGTWGPGNWLGYARHFGFMDADLVLLVIGSEDYADNPTFAPLDIDHPTEWPVWALQEAALRYLPRYLPFGSTPLPQSDTSPHPSEVARGQADLADFLRMAQAGGRRVVVLHHPDRNELLKSRYLPGFDWERKLVQSLRIPFIEMRIAYASAGEAIYRDDVHHSVLGQKVMAQALETAASMALGAVPKSPQPPPTRASAAPNTP